MKDESMRRFITIPDIVPRESNEKVFRGFQDGRVFQSMNITGPVILLRLYLDGYGVNNPLGSSADTNKILGVYYTPVLDPRIASKRQTVQNIALIKQATVSKHGNRELFEVNH